MTEPSDIFPPEFYADNLQLGSSLYGMTFTFGLMSEGGARPVASVRMSPQHTKIMALLLKRTIHEWEEKFGEMKLPPELFEELGLPEEL